MVSHSSGSGFTVSPDCLSEDECKRHRSGELTDSELARLAAHIDQCRYCQSQLDQPDNELAELARQAPPPPPLIPNYEYVVNPQGFPHVLGYGGLGVVFLARYQALVDRPFRAIKVLHTGFRITTEGRARFLREIEAISALSRQNHPGFVQIFQCGESNGCLYYVMEYAAGGCLGKHLRKQRPTTLQAAEWLLELASTMAIAHQNGIFHRDLKPSNILLLTEDSGEAATQRGSRPTLKIADFSHARLLHTNCELTNGASIGTPNYMAPEQARGEPVDSRADVYGLCAVLYEMLAGRPPFAGSTPQATVEMVGSPDHYPPAIVSLRPDLRKGRSADLVSICMKGLHKRCDDRYATVDALATDLRRFLKGEPVEARSLSPIVRTLRWCSRRPAVCGLTAALAMVVVGALLGMYRLWQDAEQDRIRVVESLKAVQSAKEEAEGVSELADKLLTEITFGRIRLDTKQSRARRAQIHATLTSWRPIGQRYLAAFPNNRPMCVMMAYVDLMLANIDLGDQHFEMVQQYAREAIVLWRRVLAAAPEDVCVREYLAETLENSATMFLRREQWVDAQNYFGQSEKEYALLVKAGAQGRSQSGLAESQFYQTVCMEETGKKVEAQDRYTSQRKTLEAVVGKAPQEFWPRPILMSVLLRLNDLAAACAQAQQMVALQPAEWGPQQYLGTCLVYRARVDGQQTTYREAQANLETAVRGIKKALEESPDDIHSWLQLAQLYPLLQECLGHLGDSASVTMCEQAELACLQDMATRFQDRFQNWSYQARLQLLSAQQFLSASRHPKAEWIRKETEALNRLAGVKSGPRAGASKFFDTWPNTMTSLRQRQELQAATALAERVRHLAEERASLNPESPFEATLVAEAWTQIAKNGMRTDNPTETLGALRQAALWQRKAYKLTSSGSKNVAMLEDRLGRLSRFLVERQQWSEAAATLFERISLCEAGDVSVQRISKDLHDLSKALVQAQPLLGPQEKDLIGRVLNENERLDAKLLP